MIENNIKNLRRQKIIAIALVTVPACVGVLSCNRKGSEGPPGPTGPAGGGSGSGLPACSDIVSQTTCYSSPPGLSYPFTLSIACSASGSVGSQAFQICYYNDSACSTCGTGQAGFGYNYSPDTAVGGLNLITISTSGEYAGGPYAQIIPLTASCPTIGQQMSQSMCDSYYRVQDGQDHIAKLK